MWRRRRGGSGLLRRSVRRRRAGNRLGIEDLCAYGWSEVALVGGLEGLVRGGGHCLPFCLRIFIVLAHESMDFRTECQDLPIHVLNFLVCAIDVVHEAEVLPYGPYRLRDVAVPL